ncbi:hypothetical protein D3C80_1627760 [compost metagenome]
MKTREVMEKYRASMIRKPTPSLDPIISATTSPSQAAPSDKRMPSRIFGREAGRMSRVIWLLRLYSSTLATSNSLVSTERIPRKVFTYTGKKAPSAISKIFDTSPNPNHKIKSGVITRWGTVRSIWIEGSSCFSASREKPDHRPSASPTEPPRRKPRKERHTEILK